MRNVRLVLVLGLATLLTASCDKDSDFRCNVMMTGQVSQVKTYKAKDVSDAESACKARNPGATCSCSEQSSSYIVSPI